MISDKLNNPRLCKQLFIVSTVILLMTVLRGIRFPNIWSYSHFLFDYEFGFMRRGFIGAVLGFFENNDLYSYDFFLLISSLIFCANLLLLAWSFKDLIHSKNMNLIAVVMIFASSSGIIFLAHNIGYADHIGLLITLITLRIKGFKEKLYFLSPALLIAMLVHEAIMVLFFPVIFMSLLFSLKTLTTATKNHYWLLSAFSVLMLLSFFLIGNSTIDTTQSETMFKQASAKTPLQLRADAFALLHETGTKTLNLMLQKWMNPARPLFLFISGCLIFPLVYFFQKTMLSMLKNEHKSIIILSILAGLSPLLLHLVAWDTMRWNTLTLTTSYLMCYLVFQQYQTKSDELNIRPSLPLLLLVLFINANTHVMLMDHRQVENFPYPRHISYIADVLTGKASFPAAPKH